MKEFYHVITILFACVGGWIGAFIGRIDGLVYTLLVFVLLDYITGVMVAINTKTLSSDVGFKGICRKVLIFILVGMGHLIDTHVLGGGTVVRTAVIFFYLANEGLSIMENSGKLGLPIPDKLKNVLEQLKDGDDHEK